MRTLLALFFCLTVSAFTPPFNRLHWHIEGGVEYIQVPAIGSRPSARWLRFAIDAGSDEIVVPGATYSPSNTRKPVGDTASKVYEDTWYFETDFAVLRFKIDEEKSVGSIGLGAASDLWSQFRFVEFCPALLELYLHKDVLTNSALVCAKRTGEFSVLTCPLPLECEIPLRRTDGETGVQLFPLAAMREVSPDTPLRIGGAQLNITLELTPSGKVRLRNKPYVIGTEPGRAIVAESLDDDNNEHSSTVVVLIGLLGTYMFYHMHGVELIPLITARTLAAFVIFSVAFIREHLTVHEKARYILVAYKLEGGSDPVLIDVLLIVLPVITSLCLLTEAHLSPRSTEQHRIALRGACVTLATLLPTFMVMLVGMDRLNVVCMAIVGGITNTRLIRDTLWLLIGGGDRDLMGYAWRGGLALVCAAVIGWIYIITVFPFVSEVLLFATIPHIVAPFVMASHLLTSTYFSWSCNVVEEGGECDTGVDRREEE